MQVDLWDKFGHKGWDLKFWHKKNTNSNNINESHDSSLLTFKGPIIKHVNQKSMTKESIQDANINFYKKNFNEMVNLLDFYKDDYIVFNLSIPNWICNLVKIRISKINANSSKLDQYQNFAQYSQKTYQQMKYFNSYYRLWQILTLFDEKQRPYCFGDIKRCVDYGDCQ